MNLLYQNLLIGPRPYRVGVFRKGINFRNHRHPDLEFNFCISGGGYELSIGGNPYKMQAGMLAIIGSMVDHQYFGCESSDAFHVSITVGSVFLGEYFDPFAKAIMEDPVFDLSTEEFRDLRETFEAVAKTKYEDSNVSCLAERGSLYQMCALILKHFILPHSHIGSNAALLSVNRIEPAMECIRNNYRDSIGISSVAALCGYSESNFCKHFKRITGISFHAALNKKRVGIACYWLRNSVLPLENIAEETGFADAKSLCRVFKKEMGITPTEYRNNKTSEIKQWLQRLFFVEQATESETVRKRISREHLSIEYLRAVRIADSHERCAATDKFAKAVRAHRLTEIMERLHPENSFEYMKRTQYAKDRSGRYPMYYIVRQPTFSHPNQIKKTK